MQGHTRKSLGARRKKNKNILPSAGKDTRQISFFAECHTADTRQRACFAECQRKTLGKTNASSRRLVFAECSCLPRVRLSAKRLFAECCGLPRVWLSAKRVFVECPSVLSVTLGKLPLCRVPDILHSAKKTSPVVILPPRPHPYRYLPPHRGAVGSRRRPWRWSSGEILQCRGGLFLLFRTDLARLPLPSSKP